MLTTALQDVLEYINGLLKIEDKLILEYKYNDKSVEDIKHNWQQLNRIKEVVLSRLEKEKNIIIQANTDSIDNERLTSSEIYSIGEKYYNDNFKQVK